MRFFLACLLFIQFSQTGWTQTGLLVFEQTSPKSIRIVGDRNLAFLREPGRNPRNDLLNLIRRHLDPSMDSKVVSSSGTTSVQGKLAENSAYSLQGHKLLWVKNLKGKLKIEPFSLQFQESPSAGIWKLSFQNSTQKDKVLEIRFCNPKKQCRSQHLGLEDWQREAAFMLSNPEGFVNSIRSPSGQKVGTSAFGSEAMREWMFWAARGLSLMGFGARIFGIHSHPAFANEAQTKCIVAGYLQDCGFLSSGIKSTEDYRIFLAKGLRDQFKCNPALFGEGVSFSTEALKGESENVTHVKQTDPLFLNGEGGAIPRCAQLTSKIDRDFFLKQRGNEAPGSKFVEDMEAFKKACPDKPSENQHQAAHRDGCKQVLGRITELEKQCNELRKANGETATWVCTQEELKSWCKPEDGTIQVVRSTDGKPVCTSKGTAVNTAGSSGRAGSGASGGGSSVGGFFSSLFSSEWFWPTVLVGAGLFFYWILTEQAKQQMRWNLNMWNQGPVQTAPPMYNPTLNPNVRGTP